MSRASGAANAGSSGNREPESIRHYPHLFPLVADFRGQASQTEEGLGGRRVTIPDYQTVMRPMLRQLADGEEHPARELAERLAEEFGLTEEELAQLVPSGRGALWRNRIHWASQSLYQARAVTRSRRGVFVISERGRHLLAAHPDRIGNDELDQYEEFRDFKSRSRTPQGAKKQVDAAVPDDNAATPDDRIAAAVAEVHAAVASELLERIHKQPPYFLERLVRVLPSVARWSPDKRLGGRRQGRGKQRGDQLP
jgi:restriction system protein